MMFTHLHVHSYYSFLDGVLSPQELVNLAVDHKMTSLALTDHNGLTGAIQFYDACLNSAIKPIIGLEIRINHPLGIGNIIILAKDMVGWSSLCKLSSIIQTNSEFQHYKGISIDQLVDNSKGLICLSGGKRGLIYQLIIQNQEIDAINYLDQLKGIFKDDLYAELQYQNPKDGIIIRKMTALAAKLAVPCVATNNVHYMNDEQAVLQRTLSAIRENTTLTNIPNNIPAPQGSSFKSSEEMQNHFENIPDALRNTLTVAERCNLTLPVGKPHYPELQFPPGETPKDLLHKLVNEGVKKKYGKMTPDIQNRLDYEINIIHDKGYTPLFLIVKDIIDFARKADVPVSSRGSAASSLVAYCLGITTPDPIELNLYFERFFNPARSTPPDIDTDLCSRGRNKVIQYVYKKYGSEKVAMVATINRFQRRSALREIAKAHGLKSDEITKLTDSLSYHPWGPSRRIFSGGEDPFISLKPKYGESRYQTIFNEASQILGYPRHLSIHPGGIIISPGRLTELVPTYLASKGIIITQFDLDSVERLGLVKIDLLGTRGLTVVGDVTRKISLWRSREFKNSLEVLDSIPTDDPKTSAMLQSTQTIGCFSIESPGMRMTLREINAKSVEDIMIALALYRPGPMTGGLKDSFIKRHLGKEPVKHIHPSLANFLENTYGVILYQEQVLRIASELAGLSLVDSDLLRRAMSHFDPGDQMKTLKSRFIKGALEISGISEIIGEKIWELMAAFAGYGFPKAHAASYAQLAWRSVWCKTHYPVEFMASVLAGWGGFYRQRVYINEARRLGLKIKPPHINHSKSQFSATYHDGVPRLFMGLDQIRGMTKQTQKRILQNRPFTTLEDFLTRVDPRPKEVEYLIMVGALDGLGTIPELLSRVKAGGWLYAQPRLFDLPISMIDSDDWDISARVNAQIDILGIGVDAHPVELFLNKIDTKEIVNTTQAKQMIDEEVMVIGIRETSQQYHSTSRDTYIIVELDDSKDILPLRLSPVFFDEKRVLISSIHPFIVQGRITKDSLTEMILMDVKKILPI